VSLFSSFPSDRRVFVRSQLSWLCFVRFLSFREKTALCPICFEDEGVTPVSFKTKVRLSFPLSPPSASFRKLNFRPL